MSHHSLVIMARLWPKRNFVTFCVVKWAFFYVCYLTLLHNSLWATWRVNIWPCLKQDAVLFFSFSYLLNSYSFLLFRHLGKKLTSLNSHDTLEKQHLTQQKGKQSTFSLMLLLFTTTGCHNIPAYGTISWGTRRRCSIHAKKKKKKSPHYFASKWPEVKRQNNNNNYKIRYNMSHPPMIGGFENTCAASVKAHIYLDVTANKPHPACKLVVSRCGPG